MYQKYIFSRLETAGSLGDIGVLLPIAMGMILICGLDPFGVFFAIGVYYVLSGIYFGVTTSVQPMKVIGAYAIAAQLAPEQVLAAGLILSIMLLLIGSTNAIGLIGKYTPRPVVRGVQLSTGTLLMAQGVKLMLGTSTLQNLKHSAEPYLRYASIGPLPLGLIIGVVLGIVILFLLGSKKWPAGLVAIASGLAIGALLGTYEGFATLKFGFNFPQLLPFGMPTYEHFAFAFFALALPQIPMTLGNAVIANADLSNEYFGNDAKRVTNRALCISMGLANLFAFLIGGMPLCHGAGGLAAHYRFGARTAGSNLIIGAVFILLALVLGKHILTVLYLIPMSVLGVLLIFAGSQLGLTVLDMRDRKEMFIILIILGITLATNLAAGFIAGIIIAHILKSNKIAV